MAFGVRISRDLIEQLQEESGVVRRAPSPSPSLPPAFQLPAYQRADPATAALLSRNRELQRTLSRSERVGGLLLKHEAEELGRVQALADQLLGGRHAGPAQQAPCGPQRAECLKCYQDHPGDELQCRSSVAAYEECSRRALFA